MEGVKRRRVGLGQGGIEESFGLDDRVQSTMSQPSRRTRALPRWRVMARVRERAWRIPLRAGMEGGRDWEFSLRCSRKAVVSEEKEPYDSRTTQKRGRFSAAARSLNLPYLCACRWEAAPRM